MNPNLKEYVKASGEEPTIGCEELAELRVCKIRVHVARVEMVRQVKAAQGQSHAVLFRHLKLFRKFCVERDERGESRSVRVALANEVLLGIHDRIGKACARFKDWRDRDAARKMDCAPRDQTVRNVCRRV